MKIMRCLFCHKKLIIGSKEKFENLCDHVVDPNMTDYPERETFRCSCQLSNGGFWDKQGDFYIKNYKKEYFNLNTNALNSFSRRCDTVRKLEMKYSKKWWYKFIEGILFKWEFAI